MWARAWGAFRHFTAAWKLLEILGLWAFFIAGFAVLVGGILAGLYWVKGLPWPLVALIFVGISMVVFSLGAIAWRAWHGKRTVPSETIEARRLKKLPSPWVLTAVSFVLVLVVIGWLKPKGESSRGKSSKTQATLQSPKNNAQEIQLNNPKPTRKLADQKSSPSKQLDPDVVSGPITIHPGGVASFGQQGGITAREVSINPPPTVSASKQVQRQTGDPATPWSTVFTISSTGVVVTGDLRLKCTGAVLKAGIGRINPASLITGSNGPDPNDPATAVYQLGSEVLSPGRQIPVAVYSYNPVTVLSGTIGSQEIHFPPD